MENITITTTSPKAVANEKKPEGWAFSIEVAMPETVAEWLDTFGEDTVFSYVIKQYRIDHQNVVRRLAEAGKTDEEIGTIMAEWKPGDKVEASTADAATTAKTAFAKLSPEARQALLAQLAGMES